MKLIDYVISQGFTKDEAERYIRSGKVQVNSVVEIIPSIKIKDTDEIIVKELKQWVSRGAYKLLKAKDVFKIDFSNKVVADIGSSTGGFTQVALESGARKVFSIDVGTNQLDYKLRSNNKVLVMEKTNLRDLTKELFDESIDIVVTDVSFISVTHVFTVMENILKQGSQVMALIKPQFEAFRDQVAEGGIVDTKYHQEIIDKVVKHATEKGFIFKQIDESPIHGKTSGNIEYITLFERG